MTQSEKWTKLMKAKQGAKVKRTRPKQIHLWLTEKEHRTLLRLAKGEKMTASELLRWFINGRAVYQARP